MPLLFIYSENVEIRVYIARITFTTLIDCFTSVMCFIRHTVVSNQLIKFEHKSSINKATKVADSAFDPAVRMAFFPPRGLNFKECKKHSVRGNGQNYSLL